MPLSAHACMIGVLPDFGQGFALADGTACPAFYHTKPAVAAALGLKPADHQAHNQAAPQRRRRRRRRRQAAPEDPELPCGCRQHSSRRCSPCSCGHWTLHTVHGCMHAEATVKIATFLEGQL